MIRLITFLSVLLFFNLTFLFGQSIQFKTYTNPGYKFSFDIPGYWAVEYSKGQDGLVCVPLTKTEKEIYGAVLKALFSEYLFTI